MDVTPTLFNTLTRTPEALPAKNKPLRLFVCGPTVYNHAHLGHARLAVFFDFFVKYLRAIGYTVEYIQNITDIDDKIIKAAEEMGISTVEVAKTFEASYMADMTALGVDAVNNYPRATDHIHEIISQIQRLVDRGNAYESHGSVYFSVSSFPTYGGLSKQRLDELTHAERTENNNDKQSPHDFVLWKASKEGEPTWNSPWGPGRPGWHIEDTAIAEKYFGFPYELHGGANELIFPHHEAEVAQAEAVSGVSPFVKHWIHIGVLTVSGEKMSKSLGNFTTIKQALKTHSPEAIRLALLLAHYRAPSEYSEDVLTQAQRNIDRMKMCVDRIKKAPTSNSGVGFDARDKFISALADDLNISIAMKIVFETITDVNTALDKNEPINTEKLSEFFDTVSTLFGLSLFGGDVVTEEIQKLLEERDAARRRKDFVRSDELRDKLASLGYVARDGAL